MTLAQSIARHIDALIEDALADGHLADVSAAEILELDTANKVARVAYLGGVERWLPYPSALPIVGEIWRVIETEDGLAWLDDWLPHGSLS